ncbi:MAG: hypothetical protein NFW15_15430, partial [Candidatus Accumulibacter sp.]|nr:hypothetical protein [Accumulibacter sp.]MCM8637296.1 hypothetical protein [Accumulibacter sp.]MCM8638220.1 hypothetical protein [Accumulibacter sp.]
SVKLAERAGSLLTEIVPSIRKTSDLVQDIASASQEQSSGVGRINRAMGRFNQTAQATAAASAELATTAGELGGQAAQLQGLMTLFRIGDRCTPPAGVQPPGSAGGGRGTPGQPAGGPARGLQAGGSSPARPSPVPANPSSRPGLNTHP